MKSSPHFAASSYLGQLHGFISLHISIICNEYKYECRGLLHFTFMIWYCTTLLQYYCYYDVSYYKLLV